MLTQTTIDALLAVKTAIQIDGSSFDMQWWSALTPCGTTCCIAGHLALLRGYKPLPLSGYFGGLFRRENEEGSQEWHISQIIAREYSDMVPYADLLFYAQNWNLLEVISGASRNVAAACRAIDAFIAKYGPEPESKPESVPCEEGALK